jgi:hypothetical protein
MVNFFPEGKKGVRATGAVVMPPASQCLNAPPFIGRIASPTIPVPSDLF